ncbi:MAG TPA: methionyl-tRNA formyltransferase [Vicinamibacterales bacterium]|nr:methionyl-tRNA formyltransferase [Vicinamibacterales bacterium]
MVRVVFFGTPVFAVPSLEALIRSSHEVVAVVSQPDRPRGRGQQLQATPTKHVALTHGISVLQPAKIRDEAFLQQIRDLRADLGVVVAFGRILPDALLAIPPLGMINVHASVLPRYRGAAPIQRAIIAGDVETGVTIMRVERELDAGPTFAVATMPIPPDATSGDMEAVLATLGAQLLLPVVDDLALGRAVETPQDHSRATHAPKITKDEGVIDWNQPADAIHNLVRGLQPWPLASTHLNGARIVLRRTLGVRSANRPNPGVRSADRPDTGARARDSALAPGKGRSADLTPGRPGTVVHAAGDELIVACGGGTLLQILELQPEGRRTMTARDFLAGHGVTEGARFTS